LTVASIERADGTTMITVSDTGPGIPDEIADKIFQPFCSTQRSRRSLAKDDSEPGGSGLGLAICRRLIEESNGSITAKSEPGEGTTLTIILPTARPERAKAV
jgi:signal transduction histidine kinase